MRERLVVFVALLALVGGLAWAQIFVGESAHAVTDVSSTVDLGAARSVSIFNSGSNPIYGQAYYVGQTVVAATTSSPMLIAAGEGYDVPANEKGLPIRYVVLICGTGLTSTAKVLGMKVDWSLP